MNSTIKTLGCLAILLLSVRLLQAQNYKIDWHTIDGGGGTCAGGSYSLSGTIGQPDAGMMACNYTLAGGFWGVLALPIPGAPCLLFSRSGSNLTLAWPNPSTGFKLQKTTSLAPPVQWMDVSDTPTIIGDQKQITFTVSGAGTFYRLIKP